jgi:hypothetical protein
MGKKAVCAAVIGPIGTSGVGVDGTGQGRGVTGWSMSRVGVAVGADTAWLCGEAGGGQSTRAARSATTAMLSRVFMGMVLSGM